MTLGLGAAAGAIRQGRELVAETLFVLSQPEE
jgi:hypothetical protein